jgi:hypothetical protein
VVASHPGGFADTKHVLHATLFVYQEVFGLQAGGLGTNWAYNSGNATQHLQRAPWPVRPPTKTALNEVVCGAMMLAYERSGKSSQVRLLLRVAVLTVGDRMWHALC